MYDGCETLVEDVCKGAPGSGRSGGPFFVLREVLSLAKEYDRVVCFRAKTLCCQPHAEPQLQY